MEKPKITNKRLWDKLTPEQQKEWVSLNKIFLDELTRLSETYNSVKAHNLSYMAVWLYGKLSNEGKR